MINKITLLDFNCSVCGARADFEIRRSNQDLDPKKYVTAGNRIEHYCHDCLPEDARKWWEYEKEIFL